MHNGMTPVFRTLVVFLGILLVAPAAVAEIYKIVNPDGTVTYTDQRPSAGAEAVELPPLSVVETDIDTSIVTDRAEAGPEEPTLRDLRRQFGDFRITQPQDEETFWGTANAVTISWGASRAIPDSMSVVLYVDGQQQAAPTGGGVTMTLERGEHQAEADRCQQHHEVRPRSRHGCPEVVQGDDDGGGVGKAVDHRVRQKIDHQPQPQDAQCQLKYTDHEGQQDGVGNVSGTPCGGQRRQGGRCHQGNHRYRAGGQLARGAEYGGDDAGQERGIQPVVRRKTGQLRIRHGLRDQHQRHGQPGHRVGAQHAAVFQLRQPVGKMERARQLVQGLPGGLDDGFSADTLRWQLLSPVCGIRFPAG